MEDFQKSVSKSNGEALPVRGRSKAGTFREPRLMRDVESPVKNRQTSDLGIRSSKSLLKYKKCRWALTKSIRRGKRHEMDLADKGMER